MAENKVTEEVEVEAGEEVEELTDYRQMISDFGDKKGKNKKPLITAGSGYEITLNE